MAHWSWIYVYPLLLVLLAGVAIYEHYSTASLSLPLSPALTILAIVLPIFSFANTLALPVAIASSGGSSDSGGGSSIALRRPVLIASILQGLQFLQLLLSIVLATLFFGAATPTSLRSCLLGTAWQDLFSAKNAAAIRRIQDALDCCGFNSVRDRAWPFAEDLNNGGGTVPCAERFGRSQACAAPWAAALRRNAGVDGGVSVAVTVLQVALFLLAQWASSTHQQQNRQQQQWWPRRRGESGWARLILPFVAAGDGDRNEGAAITRPLLGDVNGEHDENHETHENTENGENSLNEERAGQATQNGQTQTRASYGSTTQAGEQQSSGTWDNAWRTD